MNYAERQRQKVLAVNEVLRQILIIVTPPKTPPNPATQ